MARKPSVRPHAQPPDLEAIPERFKARRRWVSWRYERKPDGAWSKVPKNPATGDNASSTNDETWGTFDEAVAAMTTYGHDGLGYVFVEADGLIGLDLDHCLRPDGSPKMWALFWLQLFAGVGAYIEESVGGNGAHVIVPADPPWDDAQGAVHKRPVPDQSGDEGGSIEIYAKNRF